MSTDHTQDLLTNDACLHLENQLCFPLYACARKVVGLYTPYFKPLGITYTQYIVLLVLWEEDQLPVGDLCRKLYLDNGTMTPLLKKMEEHGLLTRTRSTKDERVVVVTLTDKGRELKQKALEIPGNIAPCMKLDPEEAQTLYKLLYKIIETI
ncbi:MAG: MarR family transcriptional regulator [Eubacteriales bacterium]|nr:MarR family transcriptional regulator [Eubacteriales bacterium]